MLRALLLPCIAAAAISGCAATIEPDKRTIGTDPEPVQAFAEVQEYSIELLDEMRLLAKTRSAKAMASKTAEQRRQEALQATTILPGFDKLTTFRCNCEIETVMRGVASRAGYDANNVFTYGTRPPGGVIVDVAINNEPLNNVLKLVDAQKGSQVDIRIDQRFKTIIIKYLEAN